MLDSEHHLNQRQLMVENQLVARGIKDRRVLDAMRRVPRHQFVPPEDERLAYQDSALPIGYGQTISQPYMVALMCELLDVGPEHKVLEIGAGSGYQAAVLGELAKEVYAIEIIPELVGRARRVIAELGYSNVHIVQGNGGLGYEPAAPFDRIMIAAAAPTIPGPLLAQLVEGGKLVAPLGHPGAATCVVATKRGAQVDVRHTIPCSFVPLVGEHGWPTRQ